MRLSCMFICFTKLWGALGSLLKENHFFCSVKAKKLSLSFFKKLISMKTMKSFGPISGVQDILFWRYQLIKRGRYITKKYFFLSNFELLRKSKDDKVCYFKGCWCSSVAKNQVTFLKSELFKKKKSKPKMFWQKWR